MLTRTISPLMKAVAATGLALVHCRSVTLEGVKAIIVLTALALFMVTLSGKALDRKSRR
ncbi:hypothetical protein AAH446_02545 [Erwinia sp. P6884]|uniref:hypothetical protein n=1 Tax=Erwinia sp. P6884 TaxID=3141450 RepID=UPI00319A1B66